MTCTHDETPSWIGQYEDQLDNFEVRTHKQVLAYVECEICGEEHEVELQNRDYHELESDYSELKSQEDDSDSNVHAVLLDIVDAELNPLCAEAQLAVYYDGQHNPEYPLDKTYTFEL